MSTNKTHPLPLSPFSKPWVKTEKWFHNRHLKSKNINRHKTQNSYKHQEIKGPWNSSINRNNSNVFLNFISSSRCIKGSRGPQETTSENVSVPNSAVSVVAACFCRHRGDVFVYQPFINCTETQSFTLYTTLKKSRYLFVLFSRQTFAKMSVFNIKVNKKS